MGEDMNNPGRREKILDQFNRDQMDDVGPLGGDQTMAVLKDMNDLQLDHGEFLKKPGAESGCDVTGKGRSLLNLNLSKRP